MPATKSEEAITQRVLATRSRLQVHFKNAQQREVRFRAHRLHSVERQLMEQQKVAAAEKRLAAEEGNIDHVSLDVSQRPASATRGARRRPVQKRAPIRAWSSPANDCTIASSSRASAPALNGRSPVHPLSLNRLCASCPVSEHPAPHPGAESAKRHTRKTQRLEQPEVQDGRRIMRCDSRGCIDQSTPPRESIGKSYLLNELPVELPTLFASPSSAQGVGCAAVADDDTSTYEVNVADLEDLLEMGLSNDNAAASANNGAPASQVRHGSSIERLGKIMAMLGPRYKTMPRGSLWEKASTEELGPLKRRLLNEARQRYDQVQEDSCRSRVTLDTDVDERIARRRWLEEKAVERRQVPMKSVTDISAAAAFGVS